MNVRNLLFLVLFSFSLLGCASKKTDPVSGYETYNEAIEQHLKQTSQKLIANDEDIPKFEGLKNHMAPGHLFSIYHPSDEKLKGRFRVDFQGVLRLPYDVRINVKGLTFGELKTEVLNRYAKFFQRGVENVDFKLLRRDYLVEVRGFVKNSGRYYVTRNEGIDKVIDKAGGINGSMADTFYKAALEQQGTSYAISLNQFYQDSERANAFTWTGGDRVYISELDVSEMSGALPIITILGGVNNPGKTLYKPNAHLFYYLGKSGGAIDNLDYNESYVIRSTDEGLKRIRFNLTEMDSLPALAPNDIVLLQAEKRSIEDLIMERLAQFATILASLAVVIAL